jgi:hypothetical protein
LQNKAPVSPACGAHALPNFSQTGNFKGFTESAMLSAGRMETPYRSRHLALRCTAMWPIWLRILVHQQTFLEGG